MPYPRPGSYDPNIGAQDRATQRGLSDTEKDIKIQKHRTKKGLHQQIRDLRVQHHRANKQLTRTLERGLTSIKQSKQDTRLQKQRGMQDFGRQLEALTRHYTQLAGGQTQAANAAGVLDEGTAAASAVARSRNERVSERTIQIGEHRLSQDAATALERLGIQATQLHQDYRTGFRQARQDTHHDVHLARQGENQALRDLHIQLERARREAAIAHSDSIKEALYGAGQLF